MKKDIRVNWKYFLGRHQGPAGEVGDAEGEEGPGQGEDEGLREDCPPKRTGEKIASRRLYFPLYIGII